MSRISVHNFVLYFDHEKLLMFDVSWGAPTDPLEEVMVFGVSRGAPSELDGKKSVECPTQGLNLREWKILVRDTLFCNWRESQLTFFIFRFSLSCSKIIFWSTINGDYVCHIETTAVMKNNQRDLWLKFAKRNPFSSPKYSRAIQTLSKETALEKIQRLLKDKKDNDKKQS